MQCDPKISSRKITEDIVKGSLIGSGVVVGLNPLFYWKNMKMIGQPFFWAHCWRGVSLSGACVIPQTALQVAIFHQLSTHSKQQTPSFFHDLTLSTTAGSMSGLATVTVELLVQNYQKHPSLKITEIANATLKSGGPLRFFSGGVALAARETLWVLSYMSLGTAFASLYAQFFGKNIYSDILGAATGGALAGVASTPADYLRAQKQDYAIRAIKVPSYWKMMKSQGIKRLFTGGIERSLGIAPACVLMMLGKKLLYRDLEG